MSEKKKKYELTIGADPEFFVLEGTGTDAKQIMSCGRFGGTKGNPQLLNNEGGFLEDGTAIEFNLSPSASLADTQAKIFRLIAEFEKARMCSISAYSSAVWKMDELRSFPQAMQLGCSPDLYAYGLRTAPSVASFKNKRFAGGHIHLGIDPWPVGLAKSTVIKLLDIVCLVPIQPWLYDTHRYAHYGYPGLYRETSYGIEWRSPDNLWCNPHYLERVASGDSKKSAGIFIDRFDQVTKKLIKLVTEDQHGTRADAILTSFFRDYKVNSFLSHANVRRSPAGGSATRNLYGSAVNLIDKAIKDDSFQGTEVELE